MTSRQHEWFIEEREYRRMEARRGRRHAFETLDAVRTALVVVDMVPFFFSDGGQHQHGIVPNVNRLAGELRRLGGTVAWVLPGVSEPSALDVERLGPEVARLFSESGGSGPLPRRVWHELEVHGDDVFVEKWASSAFFPGRCELPALLDARAVDTVLVTGTVANVCCESTARDASTLGYRVIMVADANAALRDKDLNATLHTIYRSFGDVRPTDEVIELLTIDQ